MTVDMGTGSLPNKMKNIRTNSRLQLIGWIS
jgi:hypothetical protein